ncbi:Aste57867_2629 [Aphanomyces stellatus]|uniref:Aste57867_2629 protein n=1 Tax=Aphanomyces stellatus TaxID=120398 RepID=A0A485KC84_9STRA|nr:hypothetical protein As57867_002622 [Aphanomyces stellatus]VFT79825.1 Aste57867_2629 [Aphanomyces stellatus]
MEAVSQNPTLVTAAAVGLLLAAYFTQSEPTAQNAARKQPRAVPKLVDVTLTDDELIKQGFATKKVPENIDVIVIGSGISGLTTAVALAKQGKRVLVLEQHDVAGGNNHTFEEKGYEFDTGLHYLGGHLDDKKWPNRKLFDYISNDGVEFQHLGEIVDKAVTTFADGSRDEVIFSGDLDEFKATLKARFPGEHGAIDAYFKAIVEARRNLGITVGLQTCPTWARSLFRYWNAPKFKYYLKTVQEIASTLTTNQDLIGILNYCWADYGDPPGRSAFAMNSAILNHYRGGGYYPIGGPSVIAKKVTRAIEAHGGKVLVRAPVETILVDASGAAYGVRVKGKDILAKMVVSTVGAPATYTKLIPEAHSRRVAHLVKDLADPALQSCSSVMSLFVGFKGDAKELDLPTYNIWKFPSWDHQANMDANKTSPNAPDAFYFLSFSSAKDPTYATRYPGKQCGLVTAPNFYEHVEQFKDERVKRRGDAYEALKAMWTERLLKVFLDEFPKVTRESIEVLDLGTALTNDYYLGTTRGAIYGLGHTPARYASDVTSVRSPITNLFLSGQDTVSAGIIGSATAGLLTAALIDPALKATLQAIFTRGK